MFKKSSVRGRQNEYPLKCAISIDIHEFSIDRQIQTDTDLLFTVTNTADEL